MLPLLLRLVCTRCRQLCPAANSRPFAAASKLPPTPTRRNPPLSRSSPWLHGGQHNSQQSAGGGGGGSGGGGGDPGASALLYVSSATVFMLGVAYAAVPLYRAFCRMTGTASNPLTARVVDAADRVRQMEPVPECRLTVNFTADTNSQLAWNFKPQQPKVHLVPGETVLVFYTARNPTDRPVTGIATYTVNPYQAAQYFNKIQCFCFEEQRLNPHEEVDMPVFFYIDPEYVNDPRLRDIRQITLSYCFFEAKPGLKLTFPGLATA